jgi:hypothetical protein
VGWIVGLVGTYSIWDPDHMSGARTAVKPKVL